MPSDGRPGGCTSPAQQNIRYQRYKLPRLQLRAARIALRPPGQDRSPRRPAHHQRADKAAEDCAKDRRCKGRDHRMVKQRRIHSEIGPMPGIGSALAHSGSPPGTPSALYSKPLAIALALGEGAFTTFEKGLMP